jgi:hypothetical protein
MDGLEHLALHQFPEPQARCGSVSAATQIALARHGQGWDHGYFGVSSWLCDARARPGQGPVALTVQPYPDIAQALRP